MTKKHFQYAAEVVKHFQMNSPHNKSMKKLIANEMANSFILVFKEFNPAFDKERFLEACGIDESKHK